jgi:hypothetical protein
MSHPLEHSKSSVRRWKGQISDYQAIHEYLDETKGWLGHSLHRMFRHHSEGIFECERVFGKSFINSDGKTVYTRYVAEQHVKEDCNGYIPSAKEWVSMLTSGKTEKWAIKTLKIED